MSRWSVLRLALTIVAAAAGWAVVAGACLLFGSTGVGVPTPGQLAYRLEYVLLASLVGAALAAAGVAYQAVLRNPLADPYLLGISSGANLFAYLWRLPAVAGVIGLLVLPAQAATQQGFAFAGALVAVAVVFLLASRRGRLEPVTLILVGVIVNSLCGSIYLLVYTLTSVMPSSGGAISFLVGGIQTSLTYEQKAVATSVVAAGWVTLFYLSGQLNVAGLGEAEAEALGVRIHRLRWAALLVASLVTGAAVAVSGSIGFVGLVCPHLARMIVGHDQRRLLPLATALGAALLATADTAARWLAAEGSTETLLPVGVLTSLLGGPFFLLLLYQNRRRGEVG